MEVPSDQILNMLQAISDSKTQTLNNQLKGLREDISIIRETISEQHKEVKELVNNHVDTCTTKMTTHEQRLRDLEEKRVSNERIDMLEKDNRDLREHKNKVIEALLVISILLTLINGFLIARFA